MIIRTDLPLYKNLPERVIDTAQKFVKICQENTLGTMIEVDDNFIKIILPRIRVLMCKGQWPLQKFRSFKIDGKNFVCRVL